MKEIFGFATMGLLTFDLICIIISISINYWVVIDTDSIVYNSGLWRYCAEVRILETIEICDSIDDASNDLKVIRAMMMLGLFLTFGALVTVVLKQFVFKDKKEVLYATAVILLLAAIFLLVGWSYFYAKVFKPRKDDEEIFKDVELHAGFAFAIISWILTSCGVGITILMILMEKKETSVSAFTA